jgi:hypothetical protein
MIKRDLLGNDEIIWQIFVFVNGPEQNMPLPVHRVARRIHLGRVFESHDLHLKVVHLGPQYQASPARIGCLLH